MTLIADGTGAGRATSGMWSVRDFDDDDLDQVIHVWEEFNRTGAYPVFSVGEVVSALRRGEPAMVAVAGSGMIIGTAVAHLSGDRAWVQRIATSKDWQQQGVGAALLSRLEQRLIQNGIVKVSALVPQDEPGSKVFLSSGYETSPPLICLERHLSHTATRSAILDAVGGQDLPDDSWHGIAGMEDLKRIIETQLVMPLDRRELAESIGVVPPRSVVFFGPPGTGKTSVAKAIASRLGWPFAEMFPGQMAGRSTQGLAGAVREYFDLVAQLPELVLFIDEVEEIAGLRGGAEAQWGVTNELLKAIPRFREQPNRLLICATNSVRSLDPAFLRPGRFDYVIPIGPPDAVARRAIWQTYIAKHRTGRIELDELVGCSEYFSPADIAHAARQAAQRAFERAVEHGDETGTVTADYVTAIKATRPTMTPEMRRAFDEDIDRHGRL